LIRRQRVTVQSAADRWYVFEPGGESTSRAPRVHSTEDDVTVVQAACGVAAVALVLGFLLMWTFIERGHCWLTPDSGPNLFNGFRECREVGGTAFDCVMLVALILAAPVTVAGVLVWVFRPSARGQ
jgi:hypothetical protein